MKNCNDNCGAVKYCSKWWHVCVSLTLPSPVWLYAHSPWDTWALLLSLRLKASSHHWWMHLNTTDFDHFCIKSLRGSEMSRNDCTLITLCVELCIFLVDLGVFLLQQWQRSVKVSLNFGVQLLGEEIKVRKLHETQRHVSETLLCVDRVTMLTTSLSPELDSDDSEPLSSARSPYRSFTAQRHRTHTR